MLRLARLGVALSLLVAAIPQAALAQRTATIEIYLRSPAGSSPVDFAQGEIQTALTEFVKGLPTNPRIDSVVFPDVRGHIVDWDDARERWEGSTSPVAVLWGNVEPQHGEYLVTVRIYIGDSDARSRLESHGDGFEGVQAYVGGPGPRLPIYQLIVGYALLVRAWRSADGRVEPIARALQRRIDSMQGGLGWSAPCRQRLSDAIRDIRVKAREPLSSERVAESPVPQPFRCGAPR